MIIDRPTNGSSLSADPSFFRPGFFTVPRAIVDEGFATRFVSGRDAACEIAAGRVGLGLASGEPGWLDPAALMASIFRPKEHRF
jgi:hypothetical protein